MPIATNRRPPAQTVLGPKRSIRLPANGETIAISKSASAPAFEASSRGHPGSTSQKVIINPIELRVA